MDALILSVLPYVYIFPSRIGPTYLKRLDRDSYWFYKPSHFWAIKIVSLNYFFHEFNFQLTK